MNYHNKYNTNLNKENEKNFTLPKNNDTMKLQKGVTKLGNTIKKNSPEIKTTVPNNTENKPKVNEPTQSLSSSVNSLIPKEKKEQERLQRATGTYDLKKADLREVSKHLKLKEKTPDDYYSMSVPPKELNRRLDNEAFGPKTDFSIWNFENNYDKLNKEEQSMLVHKMQLDLNNQGYRDYDGYSLKPDGIFGDKTKSVYEQYKKDKKDELEDYEPDDKKIVEGEDYQVLKNEDGKQVLLASTDMGLNGEYNGFSKSETSKQPYSYIERDKEVLTKDDYKKVQIYQKLYDYAKNVLKDDAIADSLHREAVKIRSQDKYSDHEDYGPKRIKEFDPSLGTQFVGVEGYTDGDYEYSDTKDTASIYISEPLSAFDAQFLSGDMPSMTSNANAITGDYSNWNIYLGILDWILSETYPLYGKVHEGDFVVTIKRHKGGYRPATEKEYKFYFSNSTNEIYYVK